ncbi:hypothetical protein [Geminisphaera colitermitum]|uniref:hypothetical protein n=1 Tax=Geminisphaera colitermitum TaxID=1148786 RepID=UPI0001964F7C|nr:hypothetical protein [Geminisphaera colitermitum]
MNTTDKLCIGLLGLSVDFALTDVSTVASILAGLATAAFMILSCVQKWREIRNQKNNTQ